MLGRIFESYSFLSSSSMRRCNGVIERGTMTRMTTRTSTKRSVTGILLLLELATGMLTSSLADPLSPLSRPPDWDELQKFQGTITHDRFLHLLNDVYAVGGTAQKWITVEPDYAEIQTSGKHRLKLKFAKGRGRPIAKYWHDPKTLPPDNDQPLAGVTIALD